jgi:hypothetical protein
LPPSEERVRLWDAVQRDEKAPEPWWNFLCFEYKIGGVAAEEIVKKLRSEVFTLLDMTKLKTNEAYMNLWLLYAKLQPYVSISPLRTKKKQQKQTELTRRIPTNYSSSSLTERHEIYRSMCEHGIGRQNASFYINWALFEQKQQHIDCIREIVRLAVVNDAQPAARVHKLAQDCGIRVDSVVNTNANTGILATNIINPGSSLPSGPAVVAAAGRSMPTPVQHRPTEAPSLGITAGDLAKIKNWTPSIPARRSQESAPQSGATSARPPVTKTKPLGMSLLFSLLLRKSCFKPNTLSPIQASVGHNAYLLVETLTNSEAGPMTRALRMRRVAYHSHQVRPPSPLWRLLPRTDPGPQKTKSKSKLAPLARLQAVVERQVGVLFNDPSQMAPHCRNQYMRRHGVKLMRHRLLTLQRRAILTHLPLHHSCCSKLQHQQHSL